MSDNEIGPLLPPGFKQIQDADDTNVIGPSLPLHIKTEKNNDSSTNQISSEEIGPALPPQLKKLSPNNNHSDDNNKGDDNSDEHDDTFGPALPPGFNKPVLSDGRILGPQLPPGFKQQYSSESEDEEVIGPLPLPQGFSEDSKDVIARDFIKRSQKMKDRLEGREAPKKLEREEWMTELPPVLQGKLGMGPRQFRARAADIGDRSGWTDTPADKAKKAKNKSKENEGHDANLSNVVERDSRIAQQLQDYNKKDENQPESLLSMHEKKRKRKMKEEEASGEANIRRPFDREVDLQANRFDEAAKKRMLKQSAGLSSRFSHGETSGTFL